jgi:hypothetical protein
MTSISEIAAEIQAKHNNGLKLRHLLIVTAACVIVLVLGILLPYVLKVEALTNRSAAFFWIYFAALSVLLIAGGSAVVVIAIKLSKKRWSVYKIFAKAAGLTYDHAQTGTGAFSGNSKVFVRYDVSQIATRAVNNAILRRQDAGMPTGVFGRNKHMQRYAPFTDYPFGMGSNDYICSVISGVFGQRVFNAYTYITYARDNYLFFSVIALDVSGGGTISTVGLAPEDDVRYESGWLYQLRQGMLDITDIEPTLTKLWYAVR